MARIDDPYHFLDRAFEYYITGRFAALNNLQVVANSGCSEVFGTIASQSK